MGFLIRRKGKWEVGSGKSEVGSRKWEVGSRKSEVASPDTPFGIGRVKSGKLSEAKSRTDGKEAGMGSFTRMRAGNPKGAWEARLCEPGK